MVRWLYMVALAVVAACTDTTVVGVDAPGVATALLRGTVINVQVTPVVGAVVRVESPLGLNCTTETQPLLPPNPETTDSSGAFSLLLGTVAAPGEHCVDLVVSSAALATSDTIRGVPIMFGGSSLDTTEVVLTVSW
ncbi:MAG: hypothetical protein OEO79_06715 [Gemmatimonadota bacterium]|nr:hypothetical protein [Gemmatimonadota bacterium]